MRVYTLLVLLLSVALSGCDESMNMVKPVMLESSSMEDSVKPEKPPVEETTVGGMKQDPVDSSKEESEDVEGPPEEKPKDKKDPPVVEPDVEIESTFSYYRDADFTRPLIDRVEVGTTVYTKVVFSKDVPIVISNGKKARPSIFSTVGSKKLQYRIKSRDTSNEDLKSGDAKPYQNTDNSFICKYVVQTEDVDDIFFTYVDDDMVKGDPLRVVFVSPDPSITGQDFVGQVYTLKPIYGQTSRADVQPVSGATVIIVSGTRSGEGVFTDQNGQYIFPNFEGDELHLLVKKEQFELKEVIVHRSHRTTLSNGDTPKFPRDPQETPGTILIGHRWPDEVRFILQETVVVHDLLYFEGGNPPEKRKIGGLYKVGIVVVFSEASHRAGGKAAVLGNFAHEIAHAHQHAMVSIDGSGFPAGWFRTPEGKAFAEAREKDWKEFGKVPYYDTVPSLISLSENAAEMCAHYWSVDRWGGRPIFGDLAASAPHRFQWAKKWLKKQ